MQTHTTAPPPPPPPPYDAAVGTAPGFQPPTTGRPSRFSLSNLTSRQKSSLNVSAVAAFLSMSFIYEYFIVMVSHGSEESEGVDFDIFQNKLQIIRLVLGAVGSLCLVSTVIVKCLLRTRTDIALALSVAGTACTAGYIGLVFVIYEDVSLIFEHAGWPFYASILAVIIGAVGSFLCFMEFQQPNQRVQSQPN